MNEVERVARALLVARFGPESSVLFEDIPDGYSRAPEVRKLFATRVDEARRDAGAAIAAMQEWRSVKNDPPSFDEAVLTRLADGSIGQAFRTINGYVTRFANYQTKPTHWMPLPAPPEGTDDTG